jgi:hypothetical protein
MSHQIHRNQVVELLGTPDRTEGSINDPREQREGSIQYNEKWTYEHLDNDPAGARQRIVFWHRYDLAGTMIRFKAQQAWSRDDQLTRLLQERDSRVSEAELGPNPAITPTRPYQPVSEFKGKPNLGGRIEKS